MERVGLLVKRYFDGELHQIRVRKKAAEQCLAEALGLKQGDKAIKLQEEIHSFDLIEWKLTHILSGFQFVNANDEERKLVPPL